MKAKLEVGGWARTLDSSPEGEIVRLISVREDTPGWQVWTVQKRGGPRVQLAAGFLQPLPSAYAP